MYRRGTPVLNFTLGGGIMKTIIKTCCVLSLCCFTMLPFVNAQDHFVPVSNTGETNAVVIQSATIDGSQLTTGDEIGVFDGVLCVGAVIYNGSFPISCTTILKFESPNGDVLPGARAGYPMTFKIWSKNENQTGDATPDIEQGGNFGDILTVIKILETSITEVEEKQSLPEQFTLNQNYPNPFNPVTNINYTVPFSGKVSISVYAVTGEKIKTVFDGVQSAGTHIIAWFGKNDQGTSVPSGCYFLRLQNGKQNRMIKMTLLK